MIEIERKPKPKTVIFMPNGMVATFDEHNRQIPELQGIVFEVADKLRLACNEDTEFRFGTKTMNLKWYFKEHHRSASKARNEQ